MSADERAMAEALGRCAYPIGSFDKAFARKVSVQAMNAEPQITDKQAALLPVKVRRYRRQILPARLPRNLHHLLDSDAPLSPAGVGGNDSRSAVPSGDGAGQQDPVEAGPGQLQLLRAHV